MEQRGIRVLFAIVQITATLVLLIIGLFFTLETVLCLSVSGSHLLGFTVMPALALICFTLAWLIARRKRRTAGRKDKDEWEPTPPEDGDAC